MALSKIDVANMVTGAVPVANGGTALTSGFVNGSDPRPTSKPLIINGNMAVAQRGTSVSGLTSSGAIQTVDRIKNEIGNIGTYTVAQESLSSGEAYNNGFRKAWRIDTTTADASPSAGDSLYVTYSFEGQDLQLFKKGTSNAQKFTLAFWIKSNKTGTGQVNLRDNDNSRLIGGTYTISSADTWEHKVVNFAADTTGAFDNDNAGSMDIEWWLDSGTTYSSGTTPTAWEAFSQADRNASGTLDIADNTANDWAITGIQLEVGEFSSTTLPPFQHESFAENYHRCCRYFFRRGEISRLGYGCVSGHASNLAYGAQVYYPTIMRATPSQSHTDTSGFYFTGGGQNQTLVVGGTIANEGISKFGVSVGGEASGTLGIGNAYWFNTTNSSQYIQWDAEL